jgi:Zn-dependent protease with chaperone function
VIFHIEPTFFVTQQRLQTFDQKIRGRTLAISMPLLPMLSRQELQAVLAHEFAHFSGRDTLYSIWVSPVFRSLGGSITRLQSMMQSSGSLVQTIINLLLIPPLMFLSIFYEFFASIDAIISRSREFRADWIAAKHFGSGSIVNALKKISQYGIFFAQQQSQLRFKRNNAAESSDESTAGVSSPDATNTDVSEDTLPVPPANEGAKEFDHHFRILSPLGVEILQENLDKAMTAQSGEFDSHPTLLMRINNLPVTPAGEDFANEVLEWELREEKARLIAAYTGMMGQLKQYLEQHPHLSA